MSEVPVLDSAVVSGLRQLTPPGEPDVLAQVLNLFLVEVPLRMDRLRNAWAAGNIEEVHRAAHSLKGGAGNIGARRLYEVCRQLEDRGKSGDLAGSAALVDALGVEFGKVQVEIRRLLSNR
jgi:HPt (histidine-containing phosphotransfer) domain-containing protein